MKKVRTRSGKRTARNKKFTSGLWERTHVPEWFGRAILRIDPYKNIKIPNLDLPTVSQSFPVPGWRIKHLYEIMKPSCVSAIVSKDIYEVTYMLFYEGTKERIKIILYRSPLYKYRYKLTFHDLRRNNSRCYKYLSFFKFHKIVGFRWKK